MGRRCREIVRLALLLTLLSTAEGWLYVASVLDLFSRKIVVWSAGDRMTKELVLRARDQAYARQRPKGSVLHHWAEETSTPPKNIINTKKPPPTGDGKIRGRRSVPNIPRQGVGL
ncbi:DDE-type integrase/transposase/recombinase [Ferroacidibacillus organovorans]|uniref:DDE-type integrase/transposase/recombinase n=1 Tax=Ferroacidibacillus organovorans TaxID=1765683 RepID=UPI0011783A5B